MLGRPYVLEGVVERGEGRGAGLGVPTANLGVDPSRCIPGPASMPDGSTSATAGDPPPPGSAPGRPSAAVR